MGNTARHILVIEDDVDIAQAIGARLRDAGFEPTVSHDGAAGLELARCRPPDLIVLDLLLPGLSGHEVCRAVQAEMGTPIIMLTALADETDVLVGLRTGADDYLTKPFSPRELVARVEAVLRRTTRASGRPPDRATRIGPVTIDEATRRVRVDGDDVHLTPTEFNVLTTLVDAEGTVLSRAELLYRAWGYQDDVGSRTVDSHVRSIRRKLAVDLIRTVHGVGYAIEAPR